MREDMNCDQAAEYVSALCDGEVIPRHAAEHIGACAACRQRLSDYVSLGCELRSAASLELAQPVPPLRLEPRTRQPRSFWQKGLETMRIPKFAFALLIIAVLALASSLAVVKVGAHSSGSVLMLTITLPDRQSNQCFFDTLKKEDGCGLFAGMSGTKARFGLDLRLLSHDGDQVQLGVKSKVAPDGDIGSADLVGVEQSHYSFEVGRPLKLNLEGFGKVEITGAWTDHVPALIGETQLDPGPDELRIASPILLKDKQVIGDLEGATTSASSPSETAVIYYAGVGRFLISLAPMKDAVRASVRLNRVSFEIDGREYVFLTGAPVARGEKVWVRYEPDFKPSGGGEGSFITSANLEQIAPEAVLPAETNR